MFQSEFVNTDLVIHIIQMTGDLYIPGDCKLIWHQFGLGSGFKIQGSRFRG